VSSTINTKNDADSTTTVTSGALSVELDVVTEIDAPAHAVWRVLRATQRYGEWNPFIVSLDGEVALGGRLTVVLALPDRKLQTLRPKIIRLDEGRTLAWCGRLGVPGVLDAEHRLEVHEADSRHCRFVQHEHFTGMLVPAVRSVLTVNTPAAFLAMNTALAHQAGAGRAA
jgi:hypothetical protein